ncbi:metallophosphoesterase [Gangjinia marincola]|uniref:Metallophosphoesterase n=1 Tax=Gangjinia marincola TaxID=578463 RepID=A0ABN1MEL3_9FLAO
MRWIIFIGIYVLVDIYAFQAVRTITSSRWIYGLYWLFTILVLGNMIYQVSTSTSGMASGGLSYAFGFLLSLFAPKLLLIIAMFGEDIVRFFVGIFNKFISGEGSYHFPERRKFVSAVALGLAAVPFASLLYGIYRGKYQFRVLNYVLEYEDLPEAFDGYRITQISDVHSGSFNNKEKVAYGVDLINQQKSDLILFTGDLVNNKAEEMLPWKDLFGSLDAKDGVYSVLGNHDYGDYVQWPTKEEKVDNLDQLKSLQKEMGWKLLLNEHDTIQKGNDTIKIVGVENWGAGGFKKMGDLDKASAGLTEQDFKILLSHDPSYWAEKIKDDAKKFQLTLSGHTHGMQFGIEIPGLIKWSPVQYRYEQWAGIYEDLGRYINVNRGFGFLGYPGRVGIWPEVSVIELRKKAKTS